MIVLMRIDKNLQTLLTAEFPKPCDKIPAEERRAIVEIVSRIKPDLPRDGGGSN